MDNIKGHILIVIYVFFWCQNETYHRLCVILFRTWNACDVSDPGRFLWDFDHDRMYPAWILSFLWLLVCGIVGFPYMNRAVYSAGYGMK